MSSSFPSREDTAPVREGDQPSTDAGRLFSWPHETGCRWPWAKPFLWGGIVLSASGCLLLLFVAVAFHGARFLSTQFLLDAVRTEPASERADVLGESDERS